MNVTKVAVVGGGTMGNGIVTVFALNGFPVTLVETKEELIQKAILLIE